MTRARRLPISVNNRQLTKTHWPFMQRGVCDERCGSGAPSHKVRRHRQLFATVPREVIMLQRRDPPKAGFGVRAAAMLLLTPLITGAQTTVVGTLRVTVTINPSVAVVFDPRATGETRTIVCANGGVSAFGSASYQGDLMAIQLALNSPALPEPVLAAGTPAIPIQGRLAFESSVRHSQSSFSAAPEPVIHSWSNRQERGGKKPNEVPSSQACLYFPPRAPNLLSIKCVRRLARHRAS